jgi:hypothetical protein
MLNRLRGDKIIFLDNEPGKHKSVPKRGCAALRIANQLRNTSRVRIAAYPPESEGDSPDDLEPDAIQHSIQNSKTILQRRLEDGLL